MSKLIYTSYSPNTRPSDLLLNLKLLLSPWRWKKGQVNNDIIDWFKTNYESESVYTYNYARSAMYAFFNSLEAEEGDEVIFQGFTCIAAVNPAIWAGFKPIYADVECQTLSASIDSIKSKVTARTKVIVVQYTMGLYPDLEDLKGYAEEKGVLILEDCTQILQTSSDNILGIGRIGDASVFSFGRDKVISGVDGGVLILNNPYYSDGIEHINEELTYPSLSWIVKELLFPLLWATIKITFNWWKIGKGLHLIYTKLGLLTRATTIEEKEGLLPNSLPALLPNSLGELAFAQLKDLDHLNSHRGRINKIYSDGLKDLPIEILKTDLTVKSLRFTFLTDQKHELRGYLESQNVLVGDWYSDPISPKEANPEKVAYQEGSCPIAESVCKRILNLPNHINISERDAEMIVKYIKDFYTISNGI
jgi:dTDP-4-amino-4,6-dideoxygalactose transaminase